VNAPPIDPWLGIAIIVAGLATMLGVLRALRARYTLHAELLRKMAHVGLGLATLSFPWLFREAWPVIVLGAVATGTLLSLRYLPWLRKNVGGVVHGVARSSAGDLYFPLAATGLFLVARGDWVLYTLPILTLAFADAVAALIGVRYGQVKFEGTEGKKSVEGSIAFFLVAFLATHIPLLLFTPTGRAESLLIGLTFGVLVMLLEAIAWRGLDNLFIPFGGFLLLRAFLELDAPAMLVRLLVTISLLGFSLIMRRYRTLSDAAIIAAVLVGYVAWAAGGWVWLLPPAVLFTAYTLVWPRKAQVRDRPHDAVAVFSVTSTGMLWLLLSAVFDRRDFFFPYTLSFAAHLCFIGITWHRVYRREWPVVAGIVSSALVAAAIFAIPYLLIEGTTHGVLVSGALGVVPLLVGGALFALFVPSTRDRLPKSGYPWTTQALLGLGASGLGFALATTAAGA
jgi:phytol kinase